MVELQRRQNLNKILKPNDPLVPEAVILGEDAGPQRLDRVLGRELNSVTTPRRGPVRRAARRIDYAKFDEMGEKG